MNNNRMHREQRQKHIENILGVGGGEGGSCQRQIAGGREKRQWVNHERGSAMADTDTWLGKWHHLFLFSTSLSHVGSEIEKRKIARAQSKKTRSPLDWKKKKRKVPKNVLRQSNLYDAWSCVFESLFSAHRSFLWLAKLTWISICYVCITSLLENPAVKHSKALRKPDYIITSLPKQLAAWRVPDIFNAPTSMGVKGYYRPAYSTC